MAVHRPALDIYAWKARRTPALLVLLPLALGTIAWLPLGAQATGIVLTALSYCGASALLTQLGRDAGKKREPALFESWGGAPTTRLLRHTDSVFDPLTLARYHRKLSSLLGHELPTIEDEEADPRQADAVYNAAARLLRELTRDHQTFPLVFQSVVDYGFRRNLWGMKPAGISLSALGLSASIAAIALREEADVATALVAAALCTTLAALWIFCINRDWVRTTAVSYAERLLASTETLPLDPRDRPS